jgi:hypothetical protein
MLRKAIPQQLTNASARAQAGARLDFDLAEIFAEIGVATAASHCGVAVRHPVGERQHHFGSGPIGCVAWTHIRSTGVAFDRPELVRICLKRSRSTARRCLIGVTLLSSGSSQIYTQNPIDKASSPILV